MATLPSSPSECNVTGVMARLAIAIAVALGTARAASAQAATDPPRGFPEAEVDRPLVLFAGMTSLDISVFLPTLRIAITDAMGNTTFPVSRLGHYVRLAASVEHAFGMLQPFVGYSNFTFGTTLDAGARVGLGCYGAIDVVVSDDVRNGNVDYSYREQLDYIYKAIVVPHRFSLAGRVGATTSELRLTPFMQPTVSGTYFTVFVHADAELQLTSRLALATGATVDLPAYASPGLTPESTTLNPYVQLLFAYRRWDFYANLGASDVTRTPFPYASFGLVHRWGA